MDEIMKYFEEIIEKNPDNYQDILSTHVKKIKELKNQRNKILAFLIIDYIQNNPALDNQIYELLKSFDFKIRKISDEDIEHIEDSFVERISKMASITMKGNL